MVYSFNKILLVIPSFKVGGIQRSITLLANEFVNIGLDVTIVSLVSSKKQIFPDNSIKVVKPDFKYPTNIILRIFYRLRIIIYLREKIKQNEPDIILSLSDTFNPIVLLSSYRMGIKVFVGDVRKPGGKIHSITTLLGKKYFYPLSKGFIAQTESAKKYYINKFKNTLNIKVINGMIKPSSYKSQEVKEKIILNVGRLHVDKGQDRLIRAFSKLENPRDWQLVFTADGPLKKELNKLINDLKLNSSVQFLGYVDNLDRLYAKASIFVLPSRTEGFPNALCEAMSFGIPCVCFDSFPADEIITNNYDGFIIENNDIQGLTDILEVLMNDSSLRDFIGKNALAIRNRLSVNTIAKSFLDFFEESYHEVEML